MIRNLITHLERIGTVGDPLRRYLKRTVHTDAVVEAVRQSVLEDPLASIGCRSAQLDITRGSNQG